MNFELNVEFFDKTKFFLLIVIYKRKIENVEFLLYLT